jgi:hypothetical protein
MAQLTGALHPNPQVTQVLGKVQQKRVSVKFRSRLRGAYAS